MKVGRVAKRTAGALALAVLAFFTLVPTGRYLVRAAWAEGRSSRAPDPSMRSCTTPPRGRHAAEARARARRARVCGRLRRARRQARASRRTASSITTRWCVVLSAAYRDRLRYKTWWFPIVGACRTRATSTFAMRKRAARAISSARIRLVSPTRRPHSARSAISTTRCSRPRWARTACRS